VPVSVRLPRGAKVTAVAAGDLQSLALTSTGTVLAWGGNNFGQLGDGSYRQSNVPGNVKLVKNGLAQDELSSRQRAANTPSTTWGGYIYSNYIGVPGAVSAVIVVPRLTCKAVPPAGLWIEFSVGIQSVNSSAGLYSTCTNKGAALYYPSLRVDGGITNYTSDVTHAVSIRLGRP
jgi:hypothetical protein